MVRSAEEWNTTGVTRQRICLPYSPVFAALWHLDQSIGVAVDGGALRARRFAYDLYGRVIAQSPGRVNVRGRRFAGRMRESELLKPQGVGRAPAVDGPQHDIETVAVSRRDLHEPLQATIAVQVSVPRL